jgi:hypothetical protein
MTLPTIEFTPWTPWNARTSLAKRRCKGVYMMARFEGSPPDSASHLDQNVLYIGESTKQSLKTRIKDFDQSAFGKKKSHGGGKAYRKLPNNDEDHLYISVFPVELEEDIGRIFILYVERKLLLEHVQANGKLPCCNKR